MISLVVLGATGSIGQQTLAVVRSLNQKTTQVKVIGLSAYRNGALLADFCAEFQPEWALIGDPDEGLSLKRKGLFEGLKTKLLIGNVQLKTLLQAPEITHVMAAMVGFAGVESSIAAVEAGKIVLLANKEVLITAGPLIQSLLTACPQARLLPVDSEHQAIFQCLHGEIESRRDSINRVILTASGGPFRDAQLWPLSALEKAQPEQALQHPRWKMGSKITIDSATMMNKGLEMIEACFLFSLPMERVHAWVHAQSIVHALVQYQDGSVIANMSVPSMHIPIAQALTWPHVVYQHDRPLNLMDLRSLTFEELDTKRFPCVFYAQQAWAAGSWALIALNAANESAVAFFLKKRIGFLDIARMIERSLCYFSKRRWDPACILTLEEIVAFDEEVRIHCEKWVKEGVECV
jgi:1-deoxy-D-xylulose-5-phosphate reductoisomerase